MIFWAVSARAQEFQSTNFRVLDPVIFPASFSSSSNFQLNSTISQISIGTSSITNFKISSGFLFFPFVSKPAPTATVGDSQVTLTWTAGSALLGWSISGYDVGQSSISGGPYSYSPVGNVLTSNRTGLTNGATYYFVIVVKDAFGNRIATSTQVSGTPSTVSPPPPLQPGGGGGPLGLVTLSPLVIPSLEEEPSIECRKLIVDLNCDDKVNIIDFSIMYYWFERQPVPRTVDLNHDGRVNIFDFSVMAYYWSE